METLIDYFCALLIHLCLFYFFSSALTGEIKIIYIRMICGKKKFPSCTKTLIP